MLKIGVNNFLRNVVSVFKIEQDAGESNYIFSHRTSR